MPIGRRTAPRAEEPGEDYILHMEVDADGPYNAGSLFAWTVGLNGAAYTEVESVTGRYGVRCEGSNANYVLATNPGGSIQVSSLKIESEFVLKSEPSSSNYLCLFRSVVDQYSPRVDFSNPLGSSRGVVTYNVGGNRTVRSDIDSNEGPGVLQHFIFEWTGSEHFVVLNDVEYGREAAGSGIIDFTDNDWIIGGLGAGSCLSGTVLNMKVSGTL